MTNCGFPHQREEAPGIILIEGDDSSPEKLFLSDAIDPDKKRATRLVLRKQNTREHRPDHHESDKGVFHGTMKNIVATLANSRDNA